VSVQVLIGHNGPVITWLV